MNTQFSNEAAILLGTSGFGYDDWGAGNKNTKIPFYPKWIKKKDRLAFYQRIFNTVELNTVFYNIPRPEIVYNWEKSVGKDFIFSYKIPKEFSHENFLIFDNNRLLSFLNLMRINLKQKIGPALLQLPPKFSSKYINNLEDFLCTFPSDLKLAIEFRNKTWIEIFPKMKSLLDKYSAAYCIVDEPLLPPDISITSKFSYIRFHGHGSKIWYDYKYSKEQLNDWLPKVEELKENTSEVFIYYNNHPGGNAPSNAIEFAKILNQPYVLPTDIKYSDLVSNSGLTLDKFFNIK